MFQNICVKTFQTVTSITLYQYVFKNKGTKLRLVITFNYFVCLNYVIMFSVCFSTFHIKMKDSATLYYVNRKFMNRQKSTGYL